MTVDISGKSILVTGAGGFLGRELLTQLSQHCAKRVMALTSNPDRVLLQCREMDNLECFSVVDLDLGNVPLNEVDIIIHCAFARAMEGQALADSLMFTEQLFNRAAEGGTKAIINISSQSVYGRNPQTPWNEASKLDLDSMYALAKFSSELITKMVRRTGDPPVYATSLRLASLTGPRLHDRLTSKFVRRVLDGKPIEIVGGKQILSYMDVRDAVTGILSLLAVEPRLWKDVYNLGNHWRHTILEIAEVVRAVAEDYTSNSVVIEINDKNVIFDSGMDCSLFFEETNWQPKYNLEKMIRSLFEHYCDISG